MKADSDLPQDFHKCVQFHGHICPGLAIGYAAAKAAISKLELSPSVDEEVVAIVENNSCAVDAIQVRLGCTFGKGNLIFRDWGKQVFTVLERKSGKAVRVSFVSGVPFRQERNELKKKIDSGTASKEEQENWKQLRDRAVIELVTSDPEQFFEIKEVSIQPPPMAQLVDVSNCEICGELTMADRLLDNLNLKICMDCAQST